MESPRRTGFSLLEVMIAVTILLTIMGVGVQFLRHQSNAVAVESERMEALRNAEFAATQIERELREAGAGVADAQPMIVQLDRNAITFNANMMSNDPADLQAVYRSRDADPNAVRAMYQAERLPLPLSNPSHFYPDTTYLAARGYQSGAETISYYLAPDSSATTDSTYILWRRVNALPPTLVARNIVKSRTDSIPFLTYFTQDSLGKLVPVSSSLFPLYHNALHGVSSDTGRSALTDSIRLVRVHFVALTVDPRAKKDSITYRVVESRVRLMNASLLHLTACGQKPLGVPTPLVTQTKRNASQPKVTIVWSRSNDDGIGEKDIERYAIFRRLSTSTQNGDPIGSIPAMGTSVYGFIDSSVQPGVTYVYGVAAQDCTPSVSDVSLSAPITLYP